MVPRVGQVWTTTTPIGKGKTTSVVLPDIGPREEVNATQITFMRVFADTDVEKDVASMFHVRSQAEDRRAAKGATKETTSHTTSVAQIETDKQRFSSPNPPSLTKLENHGEGTARQPGLLDVTARSRQATPINVPEAVTPGPSEETNTCSEDHEEVAGGIDSEAGRDASQVECLLVSPEGLTLECMTGSIRKSKLRARWFRTFGKAKIPRPPCLSDDIRLDIGDLFLHSYRSRSMEDDALQAWLLVKRGDGPAPLAWRTVSASRTYHPILKDRVLSFQNSKTPTWVSPNTERRHANKPTIVS